MKYIAYLLALLLIPVLFVCIGRTFEAGASTTPAPIPAPPGYSLTTGPTITAEFINMVLQANHSPAAGLGETMYEDGVKYGIDPVFALAFFMHEDSFGTTGWGAVNHSLGNTRCSAGYQCNGGYRYYPTWGAGFQDWFYLIKVQYVQVWKLTTVDEIVPVYAPSSDHNDVAGYIQKIKSAVDAWRAGRLEV